MKKTSVIKHSASIHISNTINLLQRRAWNILLANAYDELPTNETHSIKIRDLLIALGLEKSENLAYIKEMLTDIMSCVIEWNVLGKDKKNIWGAFTLLSRIEIDKGILYYAYDSHLRKRLYNPAMYARISLSMQNKFGSKHALALYELCIDYFIAKKKYGETPFISIGAFRKLMGFKDDRYKDFKILNRDVIKSAIHEINKKSDLSVTSEYKRESRRVVALRFHIRPHPVNKNPLLFKNLVVGQIR